MQNKTILATAIAILISSISFNANAVILDAFGNTLLTPSFLPSAPTSSLIIVDQPYTNGSSKLNGINSAIFGTGSNVYGDYSTGIGNGINFGSPTNVISNTTVVGNSAGTTGTGDNNIVVGASGTTSGRNNTILGAFGNATGSNSVSLGAGSNTSLNNDVSVGGRNISQVLNATSGDQAVNLNQATGLANQAQKNAINQSSIIAKGYADTAQTNAVNQSKTYTDQKSASTLTSANNYTDSKQQATLTTANNYAQVIVIQSQTRTFQYTDNVAITTLNSANQYTDQKVQGMQNQIGNLNSRLNGIDKKYAGAIASIAASSSAPFVPGKTAVTGGVGYYSGQSAVGFSFTSSQNATTGVRGGISYSQTGGVVLSAGFIKVY